jgi:hypothetical protein
LTLGTSIFLIAAGAILRYAVTANVEGINLDVVGLILMIVGVVGLALSLIWMATYAGRRERAVVRERDVVERDR